MNLSLNFDVFVQFGIVIEKASNERFSCDLCGVLNVTEDQYNQHVMGKKHQKAVKRENKLREDAYLKAVNKQVNPSKLIFSFLCLFVWGIFTLNYSQRIAIRLKFLIFAGFSNTCETFFFHTKSALFSFFRFLGQNKLKMSFFLKFSPNGVTCHVFFSALVVRHEKKKNMFSF